MEMLSLNWMGVVIGLATFLSIGVFHPIVIKSEYYFGTRCWWVFLLCGIAFIVGSVCVRNEAVSILLGVEGFSCLWSIHELFQQRTRVKKGWFPMNPRRRADYED